MNSTTQTILQNGKYRIDSILSRGRFAITYRATHQNIGQTVVIKTLNPNLNSDQNTPELIHQFIAIAKRWSLCQHPNLVRVLDLFEERGHPFLVTTYVPGQSLQSNLQTQPPLPAQQAIHYIRQIASVLQVVHQQGLIHCNLKPDSIIKQTGTNIVMLSGFGVNSYLKPNQLNRYIPNRPLSGGYAALEQYLPHEHPTPATDIYGLCATLYYLLTGEPPLEAPLCSNQITEQLIKLDKPSLGKFHQNLNPEVEQAIGWGLELQASNRPSTIKHWLDILPTPENALIMRESVQVAPQHNYPKTPHPPAATPPQRQSPPKALGRRRKTTTNNINLPTSPLFIVPLFVLTGLIAGWFGFSVTRSYGQNLIQSNDSTYLKSQKQIDTLIIDPSKPIFETPGLVGENQEEDLLSDEDLELLGDGSTNLGELLKDVAYQETDSYQDTYNTSESTVTESWEYESPSSSSGNDYPPLEPLPNSDRYYDNYDTRNYQQENYPHSQPYKYSSPQDLPTLAPVNPDVLNEPTINQDVSPTTPEQPAENYYQQWLQNEPRSLDQTPDSYNHNPKRWDEPPPLETSKPDWELSKTVPVTPQG